VGDEVTSLLLDSVIVIDHFALIPYTIGAEAG
jgi:hypothetical protein